MVRCTILGRSLAPYLPPGTNAWQPEVRIAVGSEVVVEAGPLACCHAFMDTGKHAQAVQRAGRVAQCVGAGG